MLKDLFQSYGHFQNYGHHLVPCCVDKWGSTRRGRGEGWWEEGEEVEEEEDERKKGFDCVIR